MNIINTCFLRYISINLTNNLMMNDCDMYTINNKPYIKY